MRLSEPGGTPTTTLVPHDPWQHNRAAVWNKSTLSIIKVDSQIVPNITHVI